MIPVTIRQYEEIDFPAVHWLEMTGGHEPYRSAVFIRQMAVVCPSTFLVATLDTEPVGYTIGALVQGDSRQGWILRIGVREDQQHHGIGSILLSGLLELFHTLDVRTVRLTVSPRNMPALRLYERAAFTRDCYLEAYFGKNEDRIVMTKELV